MAAYKDYDEKIIFLEAAVLLAALVLGIWLMPERWAVSFGALYISVGVPGYCAWRGSRRKLTKARRLREQLEREYLASVSLGNRRKARSIAQYALGDFPGVGGIEYFRYYSHIQGEVENGLSDTDRQDWRELWTMRIDSQHER